MKKIIKSISFMVLFVLLCNTIAFASTKSNKITSISKKAYTSVIGKTGKFILKKIDISGAVSKYSIYLPPGYTNKKKWPVILFLHGAGEMGLDGLIQTKVVRKFVAKNRTWYSAIIVMPQYYKQSLSEITMITGTLDKTEKEYSIDKKREYITGLSAGACYTWEIAAMFPNRFAAAMPISGGFLSIGDYPGEYGILNEKAARLKKMPIWAFHGAADDVVPPSESQKAVNAVRDAGGKPRYTELKGVKHNAWDYVYYDKQAIKWLFAQKKK